MKILLATDGSKFAEEAARQFCEVISQPEKTTVKIISVAESMVPVATESFESPTEYILDLEQKAKENISQAERIVQERFKNSGLIVETEVFIGSPKKTIVEEAENWGADLIVMGSHGHGFWGRLYIGSVSDAAVHHAPCSVLVVRKKEDSSDE